MYTIILSCRFIKSPFYQSIAHKVKAVLFCFLFNSVHLSSLPVAHFSYAPRRRLVVTGDSARIQDETTESSAWLFNVLGVQHRHTGPRFKVSSERQLVIVRLTSPGIEPTTSSFQVERSIQLSYAGWLW